MSQAFREVLGKQLIPHHIQEKIWDVFHPMMDELLDNLEESFAKFESGELNFEELVMLQLQISTESSMEGGKIVSQITTEWFMKKELGMVGGEKMTLV
jgi:hypothetical protein